MTPADREVDFTQTTQGFLNDVRKLRITDLKETYNSSIVTFIWGMLVVPCMLIVAVVKIAEGMDTWRITVIVIGCLIAVVIFLIRPVIVYRRSKAELKARGHYRPNKILLIRSE